MNEEKQYNLNMTFNSLYAEKYGIYEAIFLNNLMFWISVNKANNINCHDGKTWSYNSMSAFTKIFSFWSVGQIKRIIDSLKEQNIIVCGNYNKSPYDRTMWYALVDESMLFVQQTIKSQSIVCNQKMDDENSLVAKTDTITTLPDVLPDINTNTNNTSSDDVKNINFKEVEHIWNELAEKNNLTKIRAITDTRKKKYRTRISEGFILNDIIDKIKNSNFLLGIGDSKWNITFDWLIENDTNWVKVMEDRYSNNNSIDLFLNQTYNMDSDLESLKKRKELYNE